MSISKVGTYAFYNHPNLERAVVSAPVIEATAFRGATKLETVDLTSTAADTINANAFNGCSNLTHLVVRSTARSTLTATSALNGTKIALEVGGIYVPADLLNSYKGATNWSTFAANIYPIGEYPKANFDTISDSWATILANSSYATAYPIKGTKTLELTDGTKIKMDLSAVDTDIKSDNSGTAKMTWICHGVPYERRMSLYNITSGGWADSAMRSWLISDILSKIPTEIKSHIVSVKKSYRTKSPNDETLWSDDEIWIPSHKEVGFTNTSLIESDGVVYSGLFNSNAERIKKDASGSRYWWLRSASTTDRFTCVDTAGQESSNRASNELALAFGFCTD